MIARALHSAGQRRVTGRAEYPALWYRQNFSFLYDDRILPGARRTGSDIHLLWYSFSFWWREVTPVKDITASGRR